MRILLRARSLFSAVSRQSVSRSNPAKILRCHGYAGSAEPNGGMFRSPFVVPTENQGFSFRRSFVPATLLAGGFGGLAAFIHYNDEKRAVPKGKGVHNQADILKGPVIGGPFSLVDTKGQVFTEQNLLGNWVLLYFGYTSSPDVGPEQLLTMTKTINILEFDSRIVGLTGPVSAIRQMAQEYHVYFKRIEEDGDDYLVDTSHNMYLLNPNAKVVRLLGLEYNAEELAEAITTEVTKPTN